MADTVRKVPEATVAAQREAADPRASAWVRANAGAGKTYVLAQRVLRLLLSGADPSRLLCITYTKAAAAEMSNRVFEWLSEWTTASDADLAARIEAIEGRRPDAAALRRARRLFAAAVETPGGLKIQTIHAFCERLLQQFPFEASVTAGFTVLDERASAELLAEAQAEVLVEAGDDGPLAQALGDLLARLSDSGIAELVETVLRQRSAFLDWVRGAGDLQGALAVLKSELGLAPHEDEATIATEILTSAHLPRSEWQAVAETLRTGSSKVGELGHCLAAAVVAADAEQALTAYLSVFLTRSGKERRQFLTKPFRQDYPDLSDRLDSEKARVVGLCDRLAAARIFAGNAALFTVADAVIDRYQALKGARGVVDFDDLVERTAMLLGRADAGWVLFKLDGGLDHVLVDEAQDTSPRQWEIVQKMAGEFFAGQGARDANRTIFAVGDIKQSIYSFQGADPARFGDMQRHFASSAEDAERTFRSVPLRLSFRSTPSVLKAVDEVFREAPASAGLSLPDVPEAVIHEAIRIGEPGLVEIWPVEEPDEAADVTPWDAPLDVDRAGSPENRVAERIAVTIRRWLDGGDCLEATGKPIRPGDIMILMARRAPFAEPMIRALKRHDIPVAGADRLVLTDHIAVMDLMAVGRFALMPEDDLNLAALLKSPLVGMDEDGLMAIAIGRRGSLWGAIRRSEDPRHVRIRETLEEWRRRAGFERPYEFYARILGADRGRAAFHRRLGAEAFEAIDEFLGLALAYERAETPSLPGFLAWLDAAPAQVKRDMDKGRDEVRVMTVHGAKGLEAPIVFLPDTCRGVGGRGVGPLFPFEGSFGAPLVWAQSKQADCAVTRTLREAAERRRDEEQNRLLYVAMTRARDRLYVAGFATRRASQSGPTWYDLIGTGLETLLSETETPDGPVRRYVGPGTPREPEAPAQPAPAAAAVPDWVGRPAPREAQAVRPQAASQL
ncbi:double-strand break repair helicase AddA, partial [Microbaculum marinum]